MIDELRTSHSANCPVIKVSDEERVTLCPFLVPDEPDLQGDVLTAAEIEKAVHGMELAGIVLTEQILDDEHDLVDPTDMGVPLEKYVMPCDGVINGVPVKKGTAMLRVKWGERAWEQIKKGEKTGLSIYGSGDREEIAA